MKKIIGYFSNNHLLTNFLVILIFSGLFYFWNNTSKEELPELNVDKVLITARYSGASPKDIEYFVTSEIEDVVLKISGVESVSSSSKNGSCRVIVDIEAGYGEYDEVIRSIEDAINQLKLPEEVLDTPVVMEMKSSNKPIMDIAIFHKNQKKLNHKSRAQLQDVVYTLENRLQLLPCVNEISHTGYLDEEVNIYVNPAKLSNYNLSYSQIISSLRNQNVRLPSGTLSGENDAQVTVLAELDTIKKVEDAVIQSSFSGPLLRVKDVAKVAHQFEQENSITKINGHQGVVLTIRKSSTVGILDASEEISNIVTAYFENSLKDSLITYKIYNDESISVKNRLSLVGSNGIVGFFLILISLFIFLNFRSGFWVALGIPFSIAFTLAGIHFLGYSINNMTLAGVIIVLGMVVDDAIVIAENITRREEQGEIRQLAVVNGTSVMIRPVLASILTTCVAFIPLFFFSNFIGKLIDVIPAIVFLMLGGSLLESIFILPSHMNMKSPLHRFKKVKQKTKYREHWFLSVEKLYAKLLKRMINFRWIFYPFAILMLISALLLFKFGMSFELFPREVSTSIIFMGKTKPGTDKNGTELAVRPLEMVLNNYLEDNIEVYTTRIASSRRGNDANENEFSIMVQLLPAKQRSLNAVELSNIIMKDFKPYKKNFMKLAVAKKRFGPPSSSGSPIELEILENSDDKRVAIANELVKALESRKSLENVEIERQLMKKQYNIRMKRDLMHRLSITPTEVATVLRTIVDGSLLFYHYREDLEIPVQITVDAQSQRNMMDVIKLPVSNQRAYLVPLSQVVNVSATKELNEIRRYNGKRILRVYSDISETNGESPIEVAKWLESEILPELLSRYPSAVIVWGGEVEQTRESSSDFFMAMISVLVLIFFILSLLFRSILKPLLIMISIPFGIIGVIFALWLHGQTVLGLFTVIGFLGLCGVVVNDSIVMLSMLHEHSNDPKFGKNLKERVTTIASTRLRAVFLTTVTTVAGLVPTAYGFFGYDSMLSDMMLAMCWGLIFGTIVTLIFIPMLFYSFSKIFSLINERTGESHDKI